MKTIIAQFGFTDLDGVVRRITPTADVFDLRQKIARTYRFIAVAGRGSRLVWGLALLAIGGSMIAGGILLYTTPIAMPVAVLGILLILIGILIAISCDPKKIETQLRLFEAICNDATSNSCRIQAQANAEDATNEFQSFIHTWLSNQFIGGTSVPEMRQQIDAATADITQLAAETESSLAQSNQKLKAAREAWQQSQTSFRSVVTKKPAQFRPGRSRNLARRVVATGEELIKQAHRTTILECSAQLVRNLADQINSTRNKIQNCEGALQALSQDVQTRKRELLELSQTECLIGRALPSLADVFDQAQQAVSARQQEVLSSLAANTDGDYQETMQNAIEQIIVEAEVTPRSFDAWWAAADGPRRELVLEGIDTGASEFVVTKPLPGRIQQRIRHLLAYGGISCPAFEQVKARSDSVLCRAVNHADPTELFVLTESRYEPANEIVEFVACAKTFNAMPPDVQSLAITVVDDDSYITDYEPERRSDPDRPVRILVLGLLSGEVIRTGSEQYRERDITNPRNGHFGKGFEDAAASIRTDSDLGKRLEKRINQCFESEGQTAVLNRIRAAFTKNDVVPAVMIPRFRQLLLDEYQLRGGNLTDLTEAAPGKT